MDTLIKATIFKGLQQRRFNPYQVISLIQQAQQMDVGNLLMQTDPFGNTFFTPGPAPVNDGETVKVEQSDGSTATVHTPAKESDVDAKIAALRTELKQFTNKAVGQSESRVRDDIAKVLSAVNALKPPVKPPKPPKGK
jgi:hypothetical protein